MKQYLHTPTLLFATPLVLLPLLLATGSAFALRVPPPEPAQEEPQPVTLVRSYVPFPLPVTVSLPANGGMISLNIGAAIERQHGIALQAELSARDDLIPMLVTRTVLTQAEQQTNVAALRATLPEALRNSFNAELEQMGLPPAVLEVFILSWAIIPPSP